MQKKANPRKRFALSGKMISYVFKAADNLFFIKQSSSEKPKIDVCILLIPASALLLRFIYTLRSRSFFLYSLTSSSDQKSNDFRQNTSTMLGSFVFARGTIGKQNIGSDPSVTFLIFSSLSSAISICLPLLAHSA